MSASRCSPDPYLPLLLAVASGNTLSFAPTAYDYRLGETVRYTVATAATGSGGALGRSGRGSFVAGTNVAVGMNAFALVLGNVDMELDLRASGDFDSRVSMHLNNGFGVFSGTQEVATNGLAYARTLGLYS